ncbi:hydroxyethylthiazole kinase [Arthrobacter halodurans]|uniref:Hydroxyethylthiazole kinase n=1 Tax=Arthrobacter halodurans TaxID=516699 RepID=A0ABV4UTB1_9MICC
MDSRAPSHLVPPPVSPALAAESLARVRATAPLVQCLTNTVVANFTANVLLAAGASPAMVDVPGEAGGFARIASGVLVNLGTPHRAQREGMVEAARAAHEAGTAWVLDPVAVGALGLRTDFARLLVELRPGVVRGNASEVMALAGCGAGGRGVDATDGVEAAGEAATALARRTGGVVAVSGAVDLITDGGSVVRVHGGSAALTRVTGGGCALGALVAAFCAVSRDPFAGTVAAHAFYAVASETADAASSGPGSFAVAFLDALSGTTPDELAGRAVLR